MKDVLGRFLLAMEGSTGLVQPHLISPKPASPLLMASLASAFGVDSVGQAQGAFAAQVSPGCIAHKADFVKLKSGDVAEVWLHARLGSGDLVTLLQPFAGLGRNIFQQNAEGLVSWPRRAFSLHACMFPKALAESGLCLDGVHALTKKHDFACTCPRALLPCTAVFMYTSNVAFIWKC